jgi:tRNA(adenine34) deaminase
MKIDFMNEALKQAKLAYKNNEVPVGAVIVANNKIIAKAYNKNIKLNDPMAHAEILAIKKAAKLIKSPRLDDCDIYVTLEPCTMCASVISLSRIRRVYYGANDIKFGAIENGVKFFNSSSCQHKAEIYSGIREKESQKLLTSFFKNRR